MNEPSDNREDLGADWGQGKASGQEVAKIGVVGSATREKQHEKRLDLTSNPFFVGGAGGIRTPVGLHPNGFQEIGRAHV